MNWKQTLATALVRHEWLGRPIKGALRSRAVTQLPIYQKWVMNAAAKRTAALPSTKPWVLIETMLTCNARCKMCLHSERDMRGEMSMELYEKIIREVAEWGIDTVSLSVYGEPFADKHWLRRVEIARQYGLNYEVVTNGSLLRPEVLERMFELGGWKKVIFSVNGFSTEAYEEMMPPLKRDKVYANVDMFLEMKRASGAELPEAQISCVITNINAHERHDFEKYWNAKPGVSKVLIADCGDWLGELPTAELTVKGSSPKHVADGGWLAPCPSPWEQLTILYDGRVLPCCEDEAARSLVIGDTNFSTVQEIFYGEPMNRLREAHLQNQRCSHEVCGKCKVNPPWLK